MIAWSLISSCVVVDVTVGVGVVEREAVSGFGVESCLLFSQCGVLALYWRRPPEATGKGTGLDAGCWWCWCCIGEGRDNRLCQKIDQSQNILTDFLWCMAHPAREDAKQSIK